MTERELFDTYNKEIYRTCYFLLQNAQDAEDACHDVFVTVFQRDFQKVVYLKAWLMRITTNHCLNLLKKSRKKREKQLQIRHLYEEAKTSAKALETIVEEKSTAADWQKLLKELPDKLLVVVTLRYVNDLTITEIANVLHIPVGTVKSRLHKALKLMRNKLQEEDFYDLKGENPIEAYGR
ncbi:RNA polymerase sigma factor [Paenibacillus polygoni]|uniref:RNA polymerase sigma factor n=1 Tax=Paenibacillus polygoni TaxID=3050112 RepID=A0ABY8X005_9BACL|nr:RNA polymerase sigma factor [Paenibacillus polygoni]WIV18014.1 RNA polymerase sigma factor [Paenibacillus polygoni]